MKLPPTLLLICWCLLPLAAAFVPPQVPTKTASSTSLNLLLDVPDGFFTVTMVGSGLILSFAKSFGRLRMEERAWEQRLEEGRRRRLEQDPTLTELDLRRKEAALEWSAYGKPRMEEEEAYQKRVQEMEEEGRMGGGKRVRVMEREEEEEEDDRENRMTDQEINQFETEFGIDYDPYYDDPYEEDELPEGKFQSDKRHGDRFYEDGEVFYKDAATNLYYRQGAKPRSVSFFR